MKSETIAVVGESGCGKSSLMKTILALYKPTRGKSSSTARIFPNLIIRACIGITRMSAYVQQDPYGALAPFLSVKSILEEPLIVGGIKNKEERLQRINQAMEEVKLTPVSDFLEKFPHMLSGGQQQRVVIARAMIMEPKFLVADEPVSMLDASVRVGNLKASEQSSEITQPIGYLHHARPVHGELLLRTYICDVCRQPGRKSKSAPCSGQPASSLYQALLTGTSEPDAKNAETFKELPPGEPPSLVNPPTGCRFHPRCSKMIKGLCEVKFPPEFEPEEGHLVSCWLYE